MKKLIALLVILAAASAFAQKPRVAILEFKNKSLGGHHYWWDDKVGAAAQDMLLTELVKSGKYAVVEREQIAAIMQEKGLVLSGDVDPSTAMKIGKLLGVQYLITGSVTEFGKTEKEAQGGWGIGFGAKKTDFVSALDARMFSVNTGEILWADSASKEESNFNLKIFGSGGGVERDERMFDKVLRPVVKELAASLMKADLGGGTAASATQPTAQGKIAQAAGGKVFLNLGSAHGVKEGDTFTVYRTGNVIKDPDTGEVLGAEETRVGQVKITLVKGEKLSEAAVVSGEPQVGDVVK
jgi:curli biogenesis system outer membrane secretion channel CsgG